MNTCIRKIVRDLGEHKGRTFLTVFSMAIGVIGVGAVLCAYAVLMRELDANYMGTTPASASIYLEHVDPALIEAVRQLPAVDRV